MTKVIFGMRVFLSARFYESQNFNRSNGGVAFVFVRIFGLLTRLESVDSPKFSQVRNRIPKTQIAH